VNYPGKLLLSLAVASWIVAVSVACAEKTVAIIDPPQEPEPTRPLESPSIELVATYTPLATVTAPTGQNPAAGIALVDTPTPAIIDLPTPHSETCESHGRMVTGQYPSDIDGPFRSYRVYLPPCYGEDGRTYPTIYLFHGGAHSDDHWDYLGMDDVADAAINSGVIAPFLIVLPDGGELANDSSGGPRSFEGVVLDELIPFVESNYCAWAEPTGRAIGGISRGGYWALEIAFRSPHLFESVGGHSAALLDTDAGPETNPQHTALENNLGDLRIYLDIGEGDWLIENILLLHEEMSQAGIYHEWVLSEGQHGDSYWEEHLEEYLSWYTEPWPTERAIYPICNINSANSVH
jgi:enterochelin esterase-like enzyme